MDNDKLIEVNPAFEAIAKEEGFYSNELMGKLPYGSLQEINEIPDKYKGFL